MVATVRFLATIPGSTTLRLDLNDGTNYRLGRGYSFAPPPLRSAGGGNLLVDGELIAASSYGNRELIIPLELLSSTQDGRAALLRDIGREINRPTNILEVRLQGATKSVYFRTLRSPYALDRFPVIAGDGSAVLTIAAEPFGLGARVDLGPHTINNNPAHATNPQQVLLASILGDVETPAYIFTTTDLTSTTEAATPMLAVSRAGGAVYAFAQAEAFTVVTDTTVMANDAAMSGAGSNYTRTTFATDPSMTDRITSGIAGLAAGRYTVLVRVRRSVSGDVVKMRYGQMNDYDLGTYAFQPTVTLPSGTGAAIVQLGVIQIPFGGSLRENGYSGALLSGVEEMTIQAQRVSGTGNLDIDYTAFVPADVATLTSRLPAAPVLVPASLNWDGPSETVRENYSASPFGGSSGEMPALIEVSGKFPMLAPGNTNLLHFYRNIDRRTGTALADTIAATTALNVAYWPRYLSLSGA